MTNTKALLIALIGGAITFGAGIYFYSTKATLGSFEYAVAGLVMLMVLFGAIVGFKKMKDEKQGFPADDELSLNIKQKAAAKAFLFSFYLWTYILLFLTDSNISKEVPIGIGVIGMGMLFLGFWFYYSKKGIGDEYAN